MRSSFLRVMATVIVALLVVACAPSASQAPNPTTPAQSASPGASTTPSPSARPSGATTASPSLSPLPASASLPVRASAREHSNHSVLLAPVPEGRLYVFIPSRTAPAVLALLDSTGRPQAGWPVAVPGATFCDHLLPAEDGSVRIVCTMENPDGNMFDPVGAFAFEPNGRLRAGWPVSIEGFFITGQVVGDDLTLFVSQSLGDVEIEGQPSFDSGLVTIAADGTIASGVRSTDVGDCCTWKVGLDGIAYGVASGFPDQAPMPRPSRLTAMDHSGVRSGWPVSFEGIASAPAFGPGGRIALTVASDDAKTSRVLVFEPEGTAVSARSAALPVATAEYTGDTGGCTVGSPQPPVVARDGTTFVYSELDSAIYAIDPSLATIQDWPFEPGAPLAVARPGLESEHEAGYCPASVVPAVAPDRTLYLAIEARDTTVGGRLLALGLDSQVRPGWPVDLLRPGSEFWSVVVGPDGTVYALAIEPESAGSSSATILAIAPDSTVRYRTTIVEP
jgi:hypothetical protein